LSQFTFIDLFAGIGGFHAALSAMGGECVYASEIDTAAAKIYAQNWGLTPAGDITLDANDDVMNVPPHDVLVGGFPCQPFSKSGKQLGMDEARGTLFWNIAKIIEKRKPTLVLLENVQNIAGPRHIHEWEVIIKTLRELGYRVSEKPMVVSPHLIRQEFGGRPQVRNRVFIAATRIPRKGSNQVSDVEIPDLAKFTSDWNPLDWNLEKDLPLQKISKSSDKSAVALVETELEWIEAWNDFVVTMRAALGKAPLPGFPIWADDWIETNKLKIPKDTPAWKRNFLVKNAEFYSEHKKLLDQWLKRWNNLEHFPPSRRKLEWQAQDTESLWETIMHFRPSGIRAKKATYVPAMVAITQTSIIGKHKRRLSPREGARLQGLPDWFTFEGQADSVTFKQLGNGVNVGAVYNVIKAQVERDSDLLSGKPELLDAIQGAPNSPDTYLVNEHTNILSSSKKIPVDLTQFEKVKK
jgi:DNA (cytosine-5)-methyltransferase 1